MRAIPRRINVSCFNSPVRARRGATGFHHPSQLKPAKRSTSAVDIDLFAGTLRRAYTLNQYTELSFATLILTKSVHCSQSSFHLITSQSLKDCECCMTSIKMRAIPRRINVSCFNSPVRARRGATGFHHPAACREANAASSNQRKDQGPQWTLIFSLVAFVAPALLIMAPPYPSRLRYDPNPCATLAGILSSHYEAKSLP